uniref:Uncharacterized protein n=1 Tax=Pseudomonas syringae pv. actinidiae TaxID=103796 RepID=M1J9Z4_PSESF|nr:hypothetical protein [Pseudomonas syringae pv. actinidiae]
MVGSIRPILLQDPKLLISAPIFVSPSCFKRRASKTVVTKLHSLRY